MVLIPPMLKLILLIALCTLSDCFDPLDPNGNITVTFDIFQRTDSGYLARVTLENYYLYRHVDKPGWKIGWTWANSEVIWSMSGAIATDRGNCSSYGSQMPHSCKKDPVIVDLSPDMSQNRSEHCCRGGLLSARSIDPLTAFSSFELDVRNVGQENPLGQAPNSLKLMAPGPGYTCGPLLDTDPSVKLDFGGLRQVSVLRTWKSACSYSSFVASTSPACCVSLSSFYNPSITSCRNCSCGCREADKSTTTCIRPSYLPPSNEEDNTDEMIRCTDHMCPVRVHWHFKNNYVDQWRVKLTISNYNLNRNYSNWNVLVQHPGLTKNATTYSFNSAKLPTLALQDGVSLFWGIDYYNNELVHFDKDGVGVVTTEILMDKDPNSFTVSNGWAFPRRIYFNGENCEMPLPDTFPMLPNGSSSLRPTYFGFTLLFILVFLWF